MKIRRLSEGTINRIAAGEVVERPASAVKELVENALDAGAARIDVAISAAAADLILVEDDGEGMSADDLALAVERHATSKLRGDDLSNIQTMGFRGEALPSIGAVARLSIASRTADGEAHENPRRRRPCRRSGAHGFPRSRPARRAGRGARAVLRDAGAAQIPQIGALSRIWRRSTSSSGWRWRGPDVGFTLTLDGRRALDLAAEADFFSGRLNRLARIMGRDFGDNAAPVSVEREGVKIAGLRGASTYNRANSAMQFLFVNGRPVRDKLLIGAVRGAYADFLARDRHPALALFLDCDPAFVDVNVHPAKTEVRFRDSGLVRGLIVSSLKHALAAAGHRASTTVVGRRARVAAKRSLCLSGAGAPARACSTPRGNSMRRCSRPGVSARRRGAGGGTGGHAARRGAGAQLHETYIVAQTRDGDRHRRPARRA